MVSDKFVQCDYQKATNEPCACSSSSVLRKVGELQELTAVSENHVFFLFPVWADDRFHLAVLLFFSKLTK